MGICSSFSKTVLVIINVLFWICGAFLVYCAVEYLNMKGGLASIPTEKPAQLLLGAAGVFFLCGLIGFAAAIWEHKCVLGMFLVIVFLTMVMLFGGVILMATGYNNSLKHIDSYFLEEFNKYDMNISKLERMRRDAVESTLIVSESKNETNTTTAEPATTIPMTTPAKTTAVTTTAAKTTAAKTTIATTKAAKTTVATTTAAKTTTAKTTVATTKAAKTTTAKTTVAPTTAVKTTVNTSTTTNTPTTAAHTTFVPTTTAEPAVNATKVIDDLQSSFQCCGWEHNYTDWANFTIWKEKHITWVPGSCCNKTAAEQQNKTCENVLDVSDFNLFYLDGCKDKMNKSYKNGYKMLQWAALSLAILTLLGLGSILYLAFKKRRDPTELGYSSIVA